MKSLSMSTEEMKALARCKYESYKQSDIDKSLAIFPAFTDFKVTVEDQVAEGNLITSHWRMRAIHTGEFLGIAPTGKAVMLAGTTIDLVKDGKVIEYHSTIDFEGFLLQLKSML
jgi:predicted ester cyclase